MSDMEELEELEEEVKPDEARLICSECDKLFKKLIDIKEHYKDLHYDLEFPRLAHLRYPRTVVNHTIYKCEYCEKQFSNNELLEKHLIKCVSKAHLIKENEELKKQVKKLELCNNEYKEIITKLLNIQK